MTEISIDQMLSLENMYTSPVVFGRRVAGVSNNVLDVSANFKSNVSFSVQSTASSCNSPRITILVNSNYNTVSCYRYKGTFDS